MSIAAPARLVVIAPNWLGDAVMALPLLTDLRRAWPETALTLAGRRSVIGLVDLVPAVSGALLLEGRGGVGSLGSVRRNVQRLAGGAFDAALLLPNSFHAAWIVARAKIPERWGIRRDLRGRLLTRAVPRPPRTTHQAAYYQALGAGLGIPVGECVARVHVGEDLQARAAQRLRDAGLADRRFVACAPGAAYGRAKQWPPDRFAELSRLLAADDVALVLVGSAADRPVCREIVEESARGRPSAGRVIDLSGQTDLPQLAGVLSLSAGVVANDSGAMHLAAAVGARVVAIFGPTDDRQTAPLRASRTAPPPQILKTNVWCRPCMLRECPIDHRCMTRIGARAVYEALAFAKLS